MGSVRVGVSHQAGRHSAEDGAGMVSDVGTRRTTMVSCRITVEIPRDLQCLVKSGTGSMFTAVTIEECVSDRQYVCILWGRSTMVDDGKGHTAQSVATSDLADIPAPLRSLLLGRKGVARLLVQSATDLTR